MQLAVERHEPEQAVHQHHDGEGAEDDDGSFHAADYAAAGRTVNDDLQIVCFLAIAAVVTLIWCLLDRKKPHDERPYLRAYLRFYLASAMFSYGIQKVIPGQFPPPSLDRLVQTLGSSSPMSFMWTFMGTSRTYEMFAGAAELVAAVLLVARRTMLLGLLMTIGVMSNVVALNLSFDVSVKLYASHLLLMALFLAAPYARTLAEFFLRRPEPLFEKRWAHRGALVFRTLLVAVFVYVGVTETVTFYRERISLDHVGDPQRVAPEWMSIGRIEYL